MAYASLPSLPAAPEAGRRGSSAVRFRIRAPAFKDWVCFLVEVKTLHPRWEGFRRFAHVPYSSRLKRFDRPGLVEVNNRVELI